MNVLVVGIFEIWYIGIPLQINNNVGNKAYFTVNILNRGALSRKGENVFAKFWNNIIPETS